MATRNEMTEFIVKHAQGNADPAAIRNYLNAQPEKEVQDRFQHLLQGERQRIAQNDPQTVQAEADARKAQADAAQALKDYRWTALCAHNFGGKSLANVQSNRNFVEGWALGQTPTPAWLQRVLDEDPKAKSQLVWIGYESAEDQKRRNQEQDEQTKAVLLDTCRRFNLSYSDANIASTLQFFPDGCDTFQLQSAIQSGQLHLHGASWNEIEEHTSALLRAHAIKWRAKSIAELKAQSGIEREERVAILNRVTPEPTRSVGVEPLPPQITQQIILEKLNSGDRAAIATWRTRYGIQAVNARLQGLA
jgi:hypothetical protein